MLFNTALFAVFFAVFFLLYQFSMSARRPRLLLIFVFSLIFYAGWNYRFISLLLFSAAVDYAVALGLDRPGQSARRRKTLLSLSVTTNLGLLGTFKYADFVLDSVTGLLGAAGIFVSLPTLQLALPVGISFYTFQSMSYTIDVYRGQMRARRDFLTFASALAFFPQLVAGPILRASQILPQLENIPRATFQGARHGLVLIVGGLVKKTMADLLAGPVAIAFDGSAPVSAIEYWTGVLAFAGQIYGDFSGYSDIAIGLGLLLGFKIPENFRLPYFASSPVDFWRRWHITLSTWLRDYLYIPLGGNRVYRDRNLMLTMLLGGLWHGASFTFIVWGGYHGLLLVAQRGLERVPVFRRMAERQGRGARLIKGLITFYLVLMGWVFFRAATLGDALSLIAQLHAPVALPAASGLALINAALVATAFSLLTLIDVVSIHYSDGFERRAWLVWPVLALGLGCATLVGGSGNAFLYFQF
jgi:D-alanyl-lipoteichoic acid acyltransferase DltB (MBOAT superfamily)